MAAPATQATEALAGLVERVTYHNLDIGFCMLRVQARGPGGRYSLATVARALGPLAQRAMLDQVAEYHLVYAGGAAHPQKKFSAYRRVRVVRNRASPESGSAQQRLCRKAHGPGDLRDRNAALYGGVLELSGVLRRQFSS